MEPMKLYFDVRDIFRAPRLALSGKKIWILLVANLAGYVIYWIMTYLALLVSNISFSSAWLKYGLYPCVVGNDVQWFSYIPWIIGILAWLVALVLGATAVARVTYKQLKGDEFYSSGDAWKYVKKHWHAAVFTHVSIGIIALFFVVMAIVFALIGKIPYLGELFFGIPYLLWFSGSVFVVYTLVVLGVSFFFTHAIVATLEEDTMGAVFQNYSITWSQPWRIILYLSLIYGLVVAGIWVFGHAMFYGYGLINEVFGHQWLMGNKLAAMVGWATQIVVGPNCSIDQFTNCWGIYSFGFEIPAASSTMGPVQYVGGFFIAVFLFLIFATVVSYGLTIETVGETIAMIIFKKKSDDENLLERKDEEELEAEKSEEEMTKTTPTVEEEKEETEKEDNSESKNEGDSEEQA